MELHGFLNVDKPLGWTSHDVVGKLRRIVGTRKIGHAGTLDPAATGVLVAGAGRATRFLDYVQHGSKSYIAHIVLGMESESADIDGRIIPRESEPGVPPGEDDINGLFPEFLGTVDQIPPKFSSVKQGGEPLYRKARRGEEVDVPVRTVRIDSIELTHYAYPDLILAVTCGPGVYIRSLARDLGAQLRCGAYLHHLLRTRVGGFRLSQSLTLDQLSDMRFPEHWVAAATSVDRGIGNSAALLLDRERRDAWYHGRSIRVENRASDSVPFIRAITDDGQFTGIGQLVDADGNSRAVRPRIVLPGS